MNAGKHVGDTTVTMAIDKRVDMTVGVKQAPLLWGNDVTVTYAEVSNDVNIITSIPTRTLRLLKILQLR